MKDIGGLLRVSEGSDIVRVIGQGTKRDCGMWNQVGSGSEEKRKRQGRGTSRQKGARQDSVFQRSRAVREGARTEHR